MFQENNDRLQYTQTWVYDAFGNITSTSKYPYTTGELGTPTSTVSYGYTDSNWGDLLTTYNGQTIEYDEIGNPLTVTDSEGNVVESFTWTQGRQLASHTTNGVTWSYTYDAAGLRTGRTDGTNTYQYIYAGDKLVRMIYNGEVVDISYAGSQPLSLTYDGATYYYVLNGQGDVIGLTNSSGKMVIGYTFGAYGVATGLVADPELSYVLVQMNPLTYRGYVYDRESQLYYLQSRYYDPELGRFVNTDLRINVSLGVLGVNQFSYCLNTPVNMTDNDGNKPGDLFDTVDEAARDFAEYINETSIEDNREYGSYIYTVTVWETITVTLFNLTCFGDNLLSDLWKYFFDGRMCISVNIRVKVTKYTYVNPVKGSADSCMIPINWFGLHNQVALLHSHGAYLPGYANDIFSDTDKNLADKRNIPIYVVTPLGILRKYDPSNGTDIIIFDDLPYDPNHPER